MNNDGTPDISGSIFLFAYFFESSGDLFCREATEVNGDRDIDLSDAIAQRMVRSTTASGKKTATVSLR